MTFDEYYDGTGASIRKILEERSWLPALSFLVSPGRTLTQEDCGFFWTLFKDAQRDAFGAGKLSAGESLPEPEREEAPKKAAQPLEPGEYTLPQLVDMTGRCLSSVKAYLKAYGVESRRIPITSKADPRVAFRLTDTQLDEMRNIRILGPHSGRKAKEEGPLPGDAGEVPGDDGKPGDPCGPGGGARGQGGGCSGIGPDGNEHFWGSLSEAVEETGIKEGTIKWAAAKGRTVRGWTFWYFE
ncbi:MAG: hypothetical protein II837_17010 [Treponema sp.]|nr:hypothetical protein [Treponema sp.]MBQ7165908.1 hypothetical protein [Treponema sp.]